MHTATSHKVKALMLQGTCSNAGKSLLAAAFCRMLARAGLRTVPFKAQNMSLNSFVTRQGGEMGRAQALQAEACFLEPDVRMNPVLLKPVSGLGSQLLLLGKPSGMLRTKDFQYFHYDLWTVIQNAYRDLSAEADVVVLEGAGSPAEINLRRHDIVNMRMARFAKAQVLLCADIDRGGAFAALLGTMQLLTPDEQKLVRGFILNKFRGDKSLLAPAIKSIQQKSRRPFLGVVPWIDDLNLPDEDSVSLKRGERYTSAPPPSYAHVLDLAILDLPHVSNATDFDALSQEKDVRIRLIQQPQDFATPHCLILPGTRNTSEDLEYLRRTGLDTAIQRYAHTALKYGQGMLIGICGGFQMLGKELDDPLGLEGKGRCLGLGLIPLITKLSSRKTLCRRQGFSTKALSSIELPVFGYEIHHGKSTVQEHLLTTVLRADDGSPLGYGVRDSKGQVRIWGTYLHGSFDSDSFRQALCNSLRADAGLPAADSNPYARHKSLDRLADCVEQAIPLTKILSLLKIG